MSVLHDAVSHTRGASLFFPESPILLRLMILLSASSEARMMGDRSAYVPGRFPDDPTIKTGTALAMKTLSATLPGSHRLTLT